MKDDLEPRERAERQLYARLAKLRLAEMYLKQGQDQQALVLFEALAELEETAVRFRAAGLAGQAVVFWRREQYTQMNQMLDEVFEHRRYLSREMRSFVERLNQKRRATSGRDRSANGS